MSAFRSFAWAALVTAVSWPLAAHAVDLPVRKEGLWQLTLSTGGQTGPSLQQCTDASTDKLFSTNVSPVPSDSCARNDVSQSSNGYAIDAVCTTSGQTSTIHADIAGDFNSAYTMQVVSQPSSSSASTTVSIDAKWVGTCAGSQRAGDIIMPDGSKVNVVDINAQRR